VAAYLLRPKSGTWAGGQLSGRLVRFDMTVSCDARPLGGNNIQVVLGAPDEVRRGLDDDVILWLDSGWWVTLRNEFARAPDVARQIIGAISDELSAITADRCGAEAAAVFAATFEADGPRHWR
jgi:hypothetical protein